MKRYSTLAAGALASLALVTGMSVSAFAANGLASNWAAAAQQTKSRAGGAIVFGTVVSTSSTGATIKTPSNGNVAISVTSNTHFKAHSTAATMAGYKTGDQVYAVGRYINGFTASNVQYDVAPFAVPLPVQYKGTFSSAGTSSLTIALKNGQSITIPTGSTTRFTINGQKSTSMPSIPSGLTLTVQAQTLTDGTLRAKNVVGGTTPKRTRVAGTIASVGQGSFVLTRNNGQTVTVTTATSTQFRVKGQNQATAPALAAGQKVAVTGIRLADGTIAAQVVNLQTAP
jgi:hypothetical protein